MQSERSQPVHRVKQSGAPLSDGEAARIKQTWVTPEFDSFPLNEAETLASPNGGDSELAS